MGLFCAFFDFFDFFPGFCASYMTQSGEMCIFRGKAHLGGGGRWVSGGGEVAFSS